MEEKPVILLVEDNEDDVVMIRKAFEQALIDNPLYVASDGEQALEYLMGTAAYADRRSYPLPDVIMLDLALPGLDGFAVLRWVRAQPQLAGVPVIVLTGSESARDLDRAYSLGVNSYLNKPEAFRDVVKLVREFAAEWLMPMETAGMMAQGEERLAA
jgi:CheY-like chemotaxis protein